MEREDVLRVAKECGLGVTLTHSGEVGQFIEGANWTEELERFAAAMYAAGAEAMRERADDLADLVSKAMRKAWHLGQTYWQQADSEYMSHWKKADATQAKFDELVDSTTDAIRALPISDSPNTFTPTNIGNPLPDTEGEHG